MESTEGSLGRDSATRAVCAASVALSAQKKVEKAAKEALEVARRELKQKGKVLE